MASWSASCRAIEEPHREDWVIIELDAAEGPMAAEIRFDAAAGAGRGGGRATTSRASTPPAPTCRENLELFGQVGFMAYAQEEIWYRPPESERGPRSWFRSLAGRDGRGGSSRAETADETLNLQAAGAPDAWHLFDLWTHATPPAIARIEGYGAEDWEAVGNEAIVPRSALNPLLHFTEVNAWLLPTEQRAGGFAQHGASRDGPHYLRFLVRDGIDGPAVPAGGARRVGRDAIGAGILSPVRTYESAGMRAAEATGFEPIGRVTMLVREVRAQVRQPAMVPAIR